MLAKPTIASPGRILGPVNDPVTFDNPDDGADQIVITRRVHPRHLRRLATNQRATSRRARLREPIDDLIEYARRQFAHADVIQKEQGLRAQHGDVVDAMVDEVLADGVVAVHHHGDLQLRADAVHAADQHGPFVFLHVEREQSAKSTNRPEHFTAQRLADFRFEAGLQRVSHIDVHARCRRKRNVLCALRFRNGPLEFTRRSLCERGKNCKERTQGGGFTSRSKPGSRDNLLSWLPKRRRIRNNR